jgi:hypothetical protein
MAMNRNLRALVEQEERSEWMRKNPEPENPRYQGNPNYNPNRLSRLFPELGDPLDKIPGVNKRWKANGNWGVIMRPQTALAYADEEFAPYLKSAKKIAKTVKEYLSTPIEKRKSTGIDPIKLAADAKQMSTYVTFFTSIISGASYLSNYDDYDRKRERPGMQKLRDLGYGLKSDAQKILRELPA